MMAFLASLFSVANAPYTIALLVVALYVSLQAVGLLPWGEHTADADAGAGAPSGAEGDFDHGGALDHDTDFDHGGALDHGADVDHGSGLDHGADLDHGASLDHGHGVTHDHSADHDLAESGGDADHGAEVGRGPGLGEMLSSVLGVGRVPMAVIWQTLFTMFGLTGIAGTTLLSSFTGTARGFHLVFTLPVALVVGVALSAAVVRGIARLVPASSGEASRRSDLVGCVGVVISSRVTDDFGEIRLKDPEGRTLHVLCRTRPGEPQIPEGKEALVVAYDRAKDHLLVSALAKLLEDDTR